MASFAMLGGFPGGFSGFPGIAIGQPANPMVNIGAQPFPVEAFQQIVKMNPQLAALPHVAEVLRQATNNLPSIQDEAGARAAELSNQINILVTQLAQLGGNLTQAVASNAKETIDKLELALTKAYKLAVFIRDDYDDRDVDEESKKQILAQTVSGFADVDERATLGLKTIGDIHAEVVNIQNGKIVPIKNEIEMLIKTNDQQLQTVADQIKSTENTLSNYEHNLNNQQDAVRSLEKKVRDNQAATTASDIGFGILGGVIGIIIGGGKPLDPFNLHKDLDQSRDNLHRAQQQYNQTLQQMGELRNQQQRLVQKRDFATSLKATLPQISNSADGLETQSITLQRQFGLLKDTASKLLLKVKEVESRAVVAQATAYTKKEFAQALLDICNIALIDTRVIDEVQMIDGEVIAGYGKDIPGEITEAEEAIKGKIQLLQSGIVSR